MMPFSVSGHLVDIHQQRIYPAIIHTEEGKITSIIPAEQDEVPEQYILPGFTDSHVHIESSMLVPSEFARLAVVHGTIGTVSDPHEIANVCGIAGVEYMIENGKTVPFKFSFGAPSCVPATAFETAGADISAEATALLLQREDIRYLSEMMNFPGVLHGDEEVWKKIRAAHQRGKPVDGHAPGLRGEEARRYIAAGISTDHECFTAEEALDKLRHGMKIIIREGSAAKNFEALAHLLHDHSDNILFCSDDKHPDSLVAGHINQLCARAVAKEIPLFNILKAACLNPVLHYKLDTGLLREGDHADFIIAKDLKDFEILQTYINGQLVAEKGRSLIQTAPAGLINNFSCTEKKPDDFQISATDVQPPFSSHHDPLVIPVIEALDGQLITNKIFEKGKIENGCWVSDTDRDILKIVVVNRYHDAPVAKAFIKNTGIRQGALASSVAHDSHNIVAVGTDDENICRAVNLVIQQQGGISAVNGAEEKIIALPVAGLMSNADGYQVASAYTAIDRMAKEMGSTLSAPFMTLSFMALLVIPHLKLSDKGLFDGDGFSFVK